MSAPAKMPMEARVAMIRAWCNTPDGYVDPPMVNDPATMDGWQRVFEAARDFLGLPGPQFYAYGDTEICKVCGYEAALTQPDASTQPLTDQGGTSTAGEGE